MARINPDAPSATANLDRFQHHAEVITITGKSYRLRNKSGQERAVPQQAAKKKAWGKEAIKKQ